MLSYSIDYILPLAAFLVCCALILFTAFYSGHRQIRLPMLMLYGGLAFWNLCIALIFLLPPGESAGFFLYILYLTHPLILIGFSLMLVKLSGLKGWFVKGFIILLSLHCIVLFVHVNLTYFLDILPVWTGLKEYPWGQFPVAGPGYSVFISVWYYTLPVSIYLTYLIWKKGESVAMRWTSVLLLGTAFSGMMNALVTGGFSRYPVGNPASAVFLVLIVTVLSPRSSLNRLDRIVLFIASFLAACTTAMIATVIAVQIIEETSRLFIPVISIAAGGSVFLLLEVLRLTRIDSESQASGTKPDVWYYTLMKLRNQYGLTPRECLICKALIEGKTREQLRIDLDIKESTLKVQLNSVYKKTIDTEDSGDSDSRRDKLHRLTVFLSKLEDS